MAPPKFQLKSRAWNIASAVVAAVMVVLGFGGLYVIRAAFAPTGGPANLLLIGLGILTFLGFAVPGIVYVLRKRVAFFKKHIPGGTMPWIRAHLYVPIMAVAAALVHAGATPYRGGLSSGKLTLVVALLVCLSGLLRHHMIGVEREVLNANLAITNVVFDEPRAFQRLVTDLTENRRPRADIEADVATLAEPQRAAWQQVQQLFGRIEERYPRDGGQRAFVRHSKVWRAVHPPLTVLLFGLIAYHVWDVMGGTQQFLGKRQTSFASAAQCGSCHSDVFAQWSVSAMAHAQTSTIMEAQLPVTLGANAQLVRQRGGAQQANFDLLAKTCINCHAQVGARFAARNDALLPLGAGGSIGGGGVGKAVDGGNAAVNSDGVGCITCHSQAVAPGDRAGFGVLAISTGGAADYGTQYGPLFKDPKPLPERAHGIDHGTGGFWDDPIATSQLCGACHAVKADLPAGGALVLQTTSDEWQAYIDDGKQRAPGKALGCVQCHMPTKGNGSAPLVDYAPGLLAVPSRPTRQHTFVGVDYDLDTSAYEKKGMPADALAQVLDERQALLGSAASLEVVNQATVRGVLSADVVLRNNLLGHDFPTGFAFARQFWLEVSAKTASGRPVCLVPVSGVASPCGSGVLAAPADDLLQCDPQDVARAGRLDPAKVGNSNIRFAAAFPASNCDPWLANFQKILTDGDPDGDGIFTEVPYQSFLPDIVKVRTRLADQQAMGPLKSPGADGAGDVAGSAKTFSYRFDAAGIAVDDPVTVSATLRFRHLPPDFVRALEQAQSQFTTPKAARINAKQLLGNMVITDVVAGRSGQGAVLACKGPQNDPGASILACVRGQSGPAAGGGPGGKRSSAVGLGLPNLGAGTAWLVLPWTGTALLAVRRRRINRRRLVSRPPPVGT